MTNYCSGNEMLGDSVWNWCCGFSSMDTTIERLIGLI